MLILQTISVIVAGVLAGEEFIVRWGVQPAMRTLEDRAHILTRVALVRRLRIVVPALMLPAVALAVAALIVGGTGPGCWFRVAGVAALVVFLFASFAGTVPINIKVIEWDAEAPPDDWRAVITRWERIDVLRSSAAIVAFACLAIALAKS